MVRASPNAARTAVKGFNEWRGEWEIAIAAQPRDGEANAELAAYLAGLFGLAGGAVSVVSGAKDHAKTVVASGIGAAEALRRLKGACAR